VIGTIRRDGNPFAQVVLAHLKALETRRDPATRQRWKIGLVKGHPAAAGYADRTVVS